MITLHQSRSSQASHLILISSSSRLHFVLMNDYITSISIKSGVARLVCAPEITPVVVPLYHWGMERVKARAKAHARSNSAHARSKSAHARSKSAHARSKSARYVCLKYTPICRRALPAGARRVVAPHIRCYHVRCCGRSDRFRATHR